MDFEVDSIYDPYYSADESDDVEDLADLIVHGDKYYLLILKEFDGKGIFTLKPYATGLSRIEHRIPARNMNQTVRHILKHFTDLSKFESCKDENNFVTSEGIKVNIDEPVSKIFEGRYGRRRAMATLYLQNRKYLTEDFDAGGIQYGKYETVVLIGAVLLFALALVSLILILLNPKTESLHYKWQ